MLGAHIKRAKNSLLIRNAGWLFAGQGLSFVVQAASFIILARLLQSSEYGILAGAVALVTIASQYAAPSRDRPAARQRRDAPPL